MESTNTALAVQEPEQRIVAAELVTEGEYGQYRCDDIRKSNTNRKRFSETGLLELAASAKTTGIIQPILIRPVEPTEDAPQPYEIVAGERRWRASIIANLPTIPAVLRTLTDLQAAEIQILENLQREDPHPLEEAEGYEQLMMKHGYNADQLADKIKKSRSYIYGRLKLCALTSSVRERFLDNEISASTALLIARIPVPSLQTRALQEILKPDSWPHEPLSHRRAAEHIQERYTLNLDTATFPIGDTKIRPSAGSCATCPKRTGNQPEVFKDIRSEQICTDPDCFAEKTGEHAARTIAFANRNGIPVYKDEEAHQQRGEAQKVGGLLVLASNPLYNFARIAPATGMSGTVRDYVPLDQMPGPLGYIQNKNGLVDALYDRATIQQLLEEAGACEAAEAHAKRRSEQPKDTGAAKREAQQQAQQQAAADARAALEEEAAAQTAFRVALYKQMRRRDGDGPSIELVRAAAKHALATSLALPDDLLGDLYEFDGSKDAAANAYIDAAPLPDVLQILIDMIFCDLLGVDSWELRAGATHAPSELTFLTELAQSTGVDIEKVRQSLIPEAPPELPSHAALDYATEGDLDAFIAANPDRINELTQAALAHPRGELTNMLERAMQTHGYTYTAGAGFAKATEPEPAAESADGSSLAEQLAEVTPEPAPTAAAKHKSPPATAGKSKRKK